MIIPFASFAKLKSDSLIEKLNQAHTVEKKIDLYIELSKLHGDTNLSESIEYAKKALLLAKNSEAIDYLGLIYTYLGEYLILQDSIEKGEMYLNEAVQYLKEDAKPEELIKVYHSIGNRYIEKDDFADAMKNYHLAIDIATQNNLTEKLPNLYNNLGVAYLNTNNTEKALDLYTKALEMFIEINDTINTAGTTTNIGSIYIQLGQYDIALSYYKQGYELFKAFGSTEGMAHSLFKIGLLDLFLNNYESAINQLKKSIELQKEIEVLYSGSKSYFLSESYINLGIAYLKTNKRVEAKKYLELGYEIAKLSQQYRLISLAAESLSDYYKSSKDYQKALAYYETFKQYSDSSLNEESIRKLAQVELQNEFSAKLKEQELLRKIQLQEAKRKNLIYITLSIVLFLFLIIVALFLRLENLKKRKVDLERKNLATKLEHTNKELTTYVMYLLRKNEFIISIAEKLKIARLDAKAENKKLIGELIRELESNSNMVSWEEFEIRFQQVYTGFYKKLNERFPDLTPNELRLCAFFRLNMTTKEIAALTYQSINSITVARYRLRKKLGMRADENLITFLTRI